MVSSKNRICFTVGDCNGIGLEIFFGALEAGMFEASEITLIANSRIVEEYLEHFNIDFSIEGDIITLSSKRVLIEECTTYPELDFGKVSRDSGLLAGEAVEKAVAGCLHGKYDAMITLPIQKESVYLAGWRYPGHTEMIAAKCGIRDPLMIMEHNGLRVTLLTIHIPLADVSKHITPFRIKTVLNNFAKSLRSDFGINSPKIAILSLNPHGGENGSIGTEEIDIYNTTLNELRLEVKQLSISLDGPFPADGFFAHGSYKNYDGILASYHDQGLIPLKLIANGGGVNFTGGLPIIRTSPDHGTAMNIAGKGKANSQSLIDAYRLALEIIENRKAI